MFSSLFVSTRLQLVSYHRTKMPPKRQRVNEDVIAAEVVSAKEDAALKILTLMKMYDFSIKMLMDRLAGRSNPTAFD